MDHRLCLLAPAVLAALAACGDDPLSYSEPVAITLKAKSSDVVAGVITDEKNITTESSNPYGKFVSDARAALGGKDPTRISLAATSLTLGAGSNGVTGLGQVFTGEVEVLFLTSDSNNTFPAAHGPIAATDAGGPIALTSAFSTDTASSEDFVRILGGNFKVVARGPAAATFAGAGADANLQVTLTFAAFE